MAGHGNEVRTFPLGSLDDRFHNRDIVDAYMGFDAFLSKLSLFGDQIGFRPLCLALKFLSMQLRIGRLRYRN